MSSLSQISVVLPSLDPDEKLLAVVDGLVAQGFDDIILVNDGSKPENLHFFETAAQHNCVTLLHHPVNRGKGAALKTAFAWFLENRPERLGVVTVDGDNQHHPEDTAACSLHMLDTGKLTLGVRDFSLPHVPARSRSGNRLTSLIFKIFVGMTISDTQTGLRAISREDVKTLITIAGDRFEYETNMLLAMKNYGIAYDEVKIRTVYIEENKSSHFRVVKDSWRIYKLIFAHFFKYGLSSVLCALVDTGLYALLDRFLPLSGIALSAIATAGARITSSLLNFFLNRRVVFHSRVPVGKAMLRYYLLAVPQALIQWLLTEGTYRLFSINEDQNLLRSLIYIIVMGVLFIASFMVQQRWVFSGKKKNK